MIHSGFVVTAPARNSVRKEGNVSRGPRSAFCPHVPSVVSQEAVGNLPGKCGVEDNHSSKAEWREGKAGMGGRGGTLRGRRGREAGDTRKFTRNDNFDLDCEHFER